MSHTSLNTEQHDKYTDVCAKWDEVRSVLFFKGQFSLPTNWFAENVLNPQTIQDVDEFVS